MYSRYSEWKKYCIQKAKWINWVLYVHDAEHEQRGIQCWSLKSKKLKGFACSPRHLGFDPLTSTGGGECAQCCAYACRCLRLCVRKHSPNKCSTQYICMQHYDPHPSISVSFPPLPKVFHLSFSPQQSTNSLSCQSKPTFMQPIINDTIHLAWSLSLSSALFLFPLVWNGHWKPDYHSVSHTQSWGSCL